LFEALRQRSELPWLIGRNIVMLKSMKKLREEDLEITHVRGSGPGGQNRNKRMTGVRVKHLPTGLVVVATERRSQEQNRSAAFQRLEEKLEALFQRPKARVKTSVTRSAKRKRLNSKRLESQKKQFRRAGRAEFES
jgi:ribosome-associated protein